MATVDSDTQKLLNTPSSPPENDIVDKLTDSLGKVTLQQEEPTSSSDNKKDETPVRPLHIYLRPQILFLSKSPLVKTPEGMPALKDWFGDWAEQQNANKKDSEPTGTSANPRDRRFRRDPEDGDAPARPTFRSALSQPSQMGNFRHQSIRTADRDKDKDTDKERERDIRDKEGQERLRNLSDKYDRDRLLSGAPSTLRNKERDSAPHLATGAATRVGQGQGPNATRRAEGRDPLKRKIGESSEDWRRGAEPARAGRDDRTDNTRRDRDNRERVRSRSRPRREPSTARRDRDDRDRDRPRRGDDRDDHPRRERDDYFRRDWDDHYPRDKDEHHRDRDRFDHNRQRELDRDVDDDSRRWRDDGKRDERMAARRERGWDRWETPHDRDRLDDRDTRTKRPAGRDRRLGIEEGKDREDRREREKEKEPAWMETYVPSFPSGGILGGQGMDGELDVIQAWKKGLKDKERKEKEPEVALEQTKASVEQPSESLTPTLNTVTSGSESHLDEIQLFKLMMKREAERKDTEHSVKADTGISTPRRHENGLNVIEKPSVTGSAGHNSGSVTPSATPSATGIATVSASSFDGQPVADKIPGTPSDGARTLLSLITSVATEASLPPKSSNIPLSATSEFSNPAVSRVFPNPPSLSPSNSQAADRPVVDISIPAGSSPTPFNPPPGSRLLAFGSRTPSAASGSSGLVPSRAGPMESPISVHSGVVFPGVSVANMPKPNNMPAPLSIGMQHTVDARSNPGLETNTRATPPESARSARSFSPFGQPPQSGYIYDEIQEAAHLVHSSEHLRRASIVSSAERAVSIMPSEGGSAYSDLNGPPPGIPGSGSPYDLTGSNVAGANYATGKGSRFAKFFDAKARDIQAGPTARKGHAGPGFVSTSPQPALRHDPMQGNGILANATDSRAMEDIFAMLQSSAQAQRASPQFGQPGRLQSGGGQFGQGAIDLQAMQLQQLQQQQFAQNNRVDPLYDSRLDDRNFVPDGMVPGLRPAPRPRSREPSGILFNEQIDDPLHFNVQRLPQPRNVDQMYNGPAPNLYNQHSLPRNTGIQLQQNQFRGGPSPISSQSPLGPAQRLPPGLANLGGRPPHDPSQYLGSQIGVPGAGLHGGMPPNAPAQQGFNNFGGGGLGFAGNPPRGQIPGQLHQSTLALNQMANLGPSNNLELRGPNQAQLLGMTAGGPGGLGGGLRSAGGGFNPQHAQMQVPHIAMRQQQQQHIPPHMMPHMLPPHMQQQQGLPGGNSQGAQDLMALLMGGHRD